MTLQHQDRAAGIQRLADQLRDGVAVKLEDLLAVYGAFLEQVADAMLRRPAFRRSESDARDLAVLAADLLMGRLRAGELKTDHVDAYARKVLQNFLRTELRKQKSGKGRAFQQGTDGVVDDVEVPVAVAPLEQEEALRELRTRLDDRQRAIAVAHYEFDYDAKEIAEIVGTSDRAVRKHRTQITKLKARIERGEEPSPAIPREPLGRDLDADAERDLLSGPMPPSTLGLVRGASIAPGIRLLRRIGGNAQREVWDVSLRGRLLALKVVRNPGNEQWCELEMLRAAERYHPHFLRGCCLGKLDELLLFVMDRADGSLRDELADLIRM